MIKKAQDVLNDSSHSVLYKIAETMDFKLPAYVEAGVPLEKQASVRVNDRLFADDVHRMYPLTDRANTWLSGAYFAKTAGAAYPHDEYKRIAKRIVKAAEVYGIAKDVVDVMAKVTAESMGQVKQAAHEDAIKAESCYGEPETQGFPMFNQEQVKKACDYFDQNAYSYDWRRRANIAKNIMKKVAEYKMKAPETLRKEAGVGFPRRDFLAENLLSRESELDRRGLHKMAGDMRKTIKIVLEAPADQIMDKLESIREMVSGMDELSGIDEDYGRRFLPPADFIFDIGDDEAREFQEDTIPMCGEMMSAKALSALPRMLFERVMSPSMVDSMCDAGRLSPKKISVTIVRMKPNDQHNLLDVIRDYTSGACPIDVCDEREDEPIECDPEACKPLELDDDAEDLKGLAEAIRTSSKASKASKSKKRDADEED